MINKKLILVVTYLLLLLPTTLNAQKKYQSRFWEITGNGLTKPSYLYGTMHVSKKLAYYLPDTFFVAMQRADVVALESDLNIYLDEMIKSKMFHLSTSLMNQSGTENLYKDAFSMKVPERNDYAELISDDPDIINEMMYRFSDLYKGQSDFEESTYLDLFIFQCARRLNKKTIGLETFDGSMKYYLKAINPQNERDEEKEKKNDSIISMEDESENILDNIESKLIEKVEDAYRKGDLDMLDSLDHKQYPSKLYGKYLIEDRNLVMLHSMMEVYKTGQSLFTGVGAGHLPGKNGLIELLRKEGYSVRPISLDKMKTATQTKDKLEKVKLPLTFKNFTPDDKIFSVDVPGNMYEIYVFDELKQYLCIDAANAAYYTVYRIKSHNELGGYSVDVNRQRIDSLFFEYIPGKILKKTEISKFGYPGFDITSKTQRGDIRRFIFIITPLEIFIFKAAGAGDYFSDKENERFFNSISLNIQPDKWSTYAPEYGDYTASLPDYRIFDKQTEHIVSNAHFDKTFAYDKEGIYYSLMRANYSDYKFIEEDTFELAYPIEVMNKDWGFDVINRQFSTYEKHPAFETTMKTKEGKYLFIKTIIKGPHYYFLSAVNSANKKPEQYFNSFHFVPEVYNTPFFTYQDTALHYSVKTCVKPALDELVEYAGYNTQQNKYSQREEIKPYESNIINKTYFNPSTKEQIDITYEKLHDYLSIQNIDSFWNTDIDYYTKKCGLKISSYSKKEQNQITTIDYVLTDTNSTRGILLKTVLRKAYLYYMASVIDTIDGPSKFVKTFFDSFTPEDTLLGYSPLTSKSAMFFDALNSADSSKRDEAIASLDVMKFKDKNDAANFIRFLESPNYYKYNVADREDLIIKFGKIQDKSVLPKLIKMYAQSGDTSNLQFAVLDAIALQKNSKGFKFIDSIFTNEAPIPSDEDEMSDFFTDLYDTLKLSAILYPGLLKLTKYDEYKDEVNDLLVELIDSNAIKPEAYSGYKNDILREANETLKKLNSKEQKNQIQKNINEEDEDDYSYGSSVSTYSEKSDLLDYATMLAPFYKEANVKSFFEKLVAVNDKPTRIKTYAVLLKNKIPFADTSLINFAKNTETRYELYNVLKDNKLLSAFPKQYLNQLDIATSDLKSDDYKEDKDSVIFLEKVMVHTKSDSGWVYFFKCFIAKDKKYYLDYIGLMPADTNKVELLSLKSKNNYSLFRSYDAAEKWKESKLPEMKDKIKDKFRLSGRLRVKDPEETNSSIFDY